VVGDANLSHFDLTHDDAEIVPFVQRAQARVRGGKLKLVGSPWSAPPWMKKNNHMNCDLGPPSCELKNDAGTRETWALYFSKFIDALQARNLEMWGVTVQNEPEAQTGNIVYEGMHFTPELERQFVRDQLGPRLRADHPDVRLLIYDHNKDHIVEWAQTLLGDNETAQYVWGTAFHWYVCSLASSRCFSYHHNSLQLLTSTAHPSAFLSLGTPGPTLTIWSKRTPFSLTSNSSQRSLPSRSRSHIPTTSLIGATVNSTAGRSLVTCSTGLWASSTGTCYWMMSVGQIMPTQPVSCAKGLSNAVPTP
jgi:hypothetical protein